MRLRLTLPLLFALGCTPGEPPVRPEDIRGPRLTQGLPRPSFVAERYDGSPYDFRAETGGRLTFLFFGYSNCPDVCPLQLANVAAALHSLPAETAAKVRVVFVTTDPDRDTPIVLRKWLANFDSTFVGLRVSPVALEAAQRNLGMSPAMHDAELPGGGYGMSHGAHLWAFTPDDSAHVVYPMGMKREDIAADIPKLVRIWPAP